MFTNPGNHRLSIFVRRKHRIDAVQHAPLPDDESEALEQTHALYLEPRQPQSRCELARGVAQQRKGQLEPVHRLALILGSLCAQAVNLCAKTLQLLMVVAVTARLRRA